MIILPKYNLIERVKELGFKVEPTTAAVPNTVRLTEVVGRESRGGAVGCALFQRAVRKRAGTSNSDLH